jgi:hypothetical protein
LRTLARSLCLVLAVTVAALPACQPPRPEPVQTLAEWEVRESALHDGILERLGFEHLPAHGAPQAVITGRQEFSKGYSIENVHFESFPGFYVTGNLYRPLPAQGGDAPQSRPGILHAHGHFGGLGSLTRSRTSMIAACATLARMGAVVFTYDMVGFGDSLQMPHPNWDRDPPQKSIAAQVQTWDSIRALDFLLSLPEVDPERVAMTGPSGGGSQTMALAALDERIRVTAPVVMVSHINAGGCPCEMGYLPPHLPNGTMEIAALTAPRPQLVVSDGGDWTSDVPTFEFPFLRGIYELWDAQDRVANVHLVSEEHDYGPNKRAAVYPFFQQWLGLDAQPAIRPDYDPPEDVIMPDGKTLHVWTDDNPRPDNAVEGEAAVRAAFEDFLGTRLPDVP